MPNKKYVLDLNDLQFRHHRLPWKRKFLHFLFWFALSVVVAFAYNIIYQHFFESAKVLALNQDLESVKLKYTILNKKIDKAQLAINDFRLSDDKQYRPILKLDSVPESSRHPGYGGVDRNSELTGYMNSDLLIKSTSRVEDLKNQVNAQEKSFAEVETTANEWKTYWEHIPYIRPVKTGALGDKIGFRPIHPVTGEPAWHDGQDIKVPTGTPVFATGAGKIVTAGWIGDFGNGVVIDHGYGFKTTYAHLSRIDVPKGINVKRGDQIGLSGSTGSSTGPHLHYQIELFGKYENPLYYFSFDMTAEEYNEMIQTLNSGRY
jgi:murein DD-endopeptidase MepM/ murein hydrolase activator NlpD